MTVTEWIALCAFVLNFVSILIGLTWGVAKIKTEVNSQSRADFDEIKKLMSESELSIEQRTGEMGSALREKITQVELYVRDTYVRQKDFESMFKMINDRFDRIQDSLDRLNTKIDKQATTH